jgi:nitrogen fixation protein FixH
MSMQTANVPPGIRPAIDMKNGGKGGAKRRARGWWYPWIFVGMFGVVIAVNGIFVFFALDTWTGLTTDHAYDEGIAYNKALAAVAEQQALGWKTAFELKDSGAQRGRLALAIKDHDGRVLSGGKVAAHFIRPTSEGHDFVVDLAPAPDGRYVADIAMPLPGQWDVEIDVSHPQGDYRITRRVIIK